MKNHSTILCQGLSNHHSNATSMSLAFHLTPINSTLLKVQAADGGDVNEKLVIRYLQGNVHIYILYIYIYT